jgi:hypothetical protein
MYLASGSVIEEDKSTTNAIRMPHWGIMLGFARIIAQ